MRLQSSSRLLCWEMNREPNQRKEASESPGTVAYDGRCDVAAHPGVNIGKAELGTKTTDVLREASSAPKQFSAHISSRCDKQTMLFGDQRRGFLTPQTSIRKAGRG